MHFFIFHLVSISLFSPFRSPVRRLPSIEKVIFLLAPFYSSTPSPSHLYHLPPHPQPLKGRPSRNHIFYFSFILSPFRSFALSLFRPFVPLLYLPIATSPRRSFAPSTPGYPCQICLMVGINLTGNASSLPRSYSYLNASTGLRQAARKVKSETTPRTAVDTSKETNTNTHHLMEMA